MKKFIFGLVIDKIFVSLTFFLRNYASHPFEGRLTYSINILFVISFVFFSDSLSYSQDFSFTQKSGGNSQESVYFSGTYTNPWAGGINAPQFSTCNLDNKGTKGLIVFDRSSDKLMVFQSKTVDNKPTWIHAPQFESLFPDIDNWMLMVDYDGDGKKDLFTYAPAGMKIFKNVSSGNLAFQEILNPVYTQGFSGKINLYVASSDIPAIVDADNDGDIDVLAFDSGGNTVEFHRNYSIENYGDKTHFEFKKIGYCWGNFLKEHFNDVRFDLDCNPKENAQQKAAKVLHSGNSILLLDLNADGKKDMLYGHVTANNIGSMMNEGTDNQAIFKKATYTYPESKPATFKVFLAPFNEDFDQDGTKDLVVATNSADNGSFSVDYQKSAWFYKNKGSDTKPIWEFVNDNFLQNSMIDLGENASPLLIDIDGDKDLDLLVSNGGIRGETGVRASISLFENKKDNNQKSYFELKSSDYLNLSKTLQLSDIKIFTSDFNGDNIPDLGWIANTFNGVEMRYIPNKSTGKGFDLNATESVIIPLVAEMSNGDFPLFIDADKDGITDILLAKSRGNIQFWKNRGTNKTPSYTLDREEYGGVKPNYLAGGLHLMVIDLDFDKKPELVTASRSGIMKIYPNFTEQNAAIFKGDSTIFSNELSQKKEFKKLGGNLIVTAGDLNGDLLPDFIVGTNAGGLLLLENSSKIVILSTENEVSTDWIYPNPTQQIINIKIPYQSDIQLVDKMGKTLQVLPNVRPNEEKQINLSGLIDDLYLVKITNEKGGIITKKVILRK
jgi:Secretion system C-terminal sorting domain/FG-GAP-like repeat